MFFSAKQIRFARSVSRKTAPGLTLLHLLLLYVASTTLLTLPFPATISTDSAVDRTEYQTRLAYRTRSNLKLIRVTLNRSRLTKAELSLALTRDLESSSAAESRPAHQARVEMSNFSLERLLNFPFDDLAESATMIPGWGIVTQANLIESVCLFEPSSYQDFMSENAHSGFV